VFALRVALPGYQQRASRLLFFALLKLLEQRLDNIPGRRIARLAALHCLLALGLKRAAASRARAVSSSSARAASWPASREASACAASASLRAAAQAMRFFSSAMRLCLDTLA
jgi:hypothetical protein